MDFIYLLVVLQLAALSEGRELVQANVIWRHGDRSSQHTYPNDPYKGVWKDGVMQLTEIGIEQEFKLGAFLHSKYSHLLSSKYKEGEIYVKSTDTDRSIMSAQCVTAGLYAPLNDSKWNGIHTAWRPFPIHVAPLESDWLMQVQYHPDKGCPNYDILRKKLLNSHWYKDNQKQYLEFYQNLAKFTGVNETYTIHNINPIYDNLFCLKSNGYHLPEWVTEDVMKNLVYLTDLECGLSWTDIDYEYRKTISRLRSGVILQKMLENMKNKIDGEKKYSFVGYSAHDTTVAPLLVSLGAYNWRRPPYSACVMLELYREDDLSYSVEFWYRNSSDHDAFKLNFYDCGSSCSFQKFEKIADELLPGDDFDSLCGVKKSEVYCCAYLLIGLSVFIFCSVLFLIVHCVFFGKGKRNTYEIVPLDESEKSLMHSSVVN